MPDLAASDFAPGQEYRVGSDDEAVTLRVDKVEVLPQAVREAGSFRLELTGPENPPLEQATYRMTREDETREIFIVPIAREAGAMRYEAVFN